MEQAVETLLHGREFKQLLESKILEIREKYGLRKIDVEILYYLYRFREQDTSKDIRAAYMFTKGHISQSVEHLQQMHLLVAVPDQKDRRRGHLHLTAAAEGIVCSIEKMWEDMTAVIFEGITEQERDTLHTIAAKMTKNMEKALTATQKQKETDANGI